MIRKKTCPGCGEKFIPTNGKHEWCTTQCRKKHTRKAPYSYGTAICECCGDLFEKRQPDQRCCSKLCAGEIKSRERAEGIVRQGVIEKIMITTAIPVFEHMRPKIGHIYEGQKGGGASNKSTPFWIVRINENPIVVREGECCVIGGVSL